MSGRTARLCVPFVSGVLFAAPGWAQEVQRCEATDGKVTYSNSACPPGSRPVRTIDPDPPPSAADQKAARERTQRYLRQVENLERSREKEQQEAQRARLAAEEAERRRAVECRALESRVHAAREERDKATLQKRQQADRKLRLAQERFDARCPRF